MFVEASEQIVDGTGSHETFAKQPNRLGVRHLVGKAEPQVSIGVEYSMPKPTPATA